ncbi:MAG: hypothetical protein ABL885_05115 [Methylophilaceae bacterium]
MIGKVGRITILAILVALGIILVFERSLPNAPITDDVYLLAGFIGVIVAAMVDWLWTHLTGQKKS